MLLGENIFRRSIGERRNRRGRRIPGHRGKNRGSDDEEIGHIMALAKFVDHRVFWIGAHSCPARPAIGSAFFFSPDFARAGRAHDFLSDSRHEFLQALFVLVKIEGDARQRHAPAIAMMWIQIDPIVSVRQGFGLHVEIQSGKDA